MPDDLDHYEQDAGTVLGLAEKGPSAYRIVSLDDYGAGRLDPFCRENLLKRAIRTRLTDRDIEFTFGRGGDRVYLVMQTGEPDTYLAGEDRWVLGEEVDANYLNDADPAAFLSEQRVPLTDRPLLTEAQILAVINGATAPGLSRVAVLGKDGKFEERYFVEVSNHEGTIASRFITTTRKETRFDRDVDGRLRVRLRPAEYALETEELTEAVPQETGRLNFHMISRLHLDRELARLHRERREHPMRKVLYPYTGCSPKANLGSDDEVSWRDATYRRAILLKRKNSRRIKGKQIRDLPTGLYYDPNDQQYKVRIGTLNIDGLRIIAHNRAERNSRTAKAAYEQLMEALVHVAVRGQPDERLTAWEMLARYGANGLQTGSRMFYEAIFERPESSWIYPDDGARARAFERFAYHSLFMQMQAALHAAYDIDPAETTVEQYNPFWQEADHEIRYGQVHYTSDLENPDVRHAHQPWVKLVNDFVRAHFDRSLPSEQYRFRQTLSRLFGGHDKQSYRSKARAMQRVVELTIHAISHPTVAWLYEPDGKGGGEWKLEVDWSTFDYFAEGIEAVRDWVRMLGEWKFSKSAENAYASMSFGQETIDSLRGNDWGGIWNPVPYSSCWSFWILYNFCKKRSPLPVEPASPYDGSPKQLVGETKQEWTERLRVWHSKYMAGKPVQPVRGTETDEQWNLSVQQWNKDAIAWMQARDQRWIDDLKEYNSAVHRRVVWMGWAWADRLPDDTMSHDGSLRAITAQKWADWLSMAAQARGFNSALGAGLVPDLDTFLTDQSSKVRNYRNETHWMESDEGACYDPQAFWGYLGGILRKQVVSIINYRLQAYRESPQFLKTVWHITDVQNETATSIRDQLEKMWENAPLKGMKRRLQQIWDDALAENVVHMRPRYAKFLEGLPEGVLQGLGPLILAMNRRSDYRVRLWAQNLSSGRDGGKRAFSLGMAMRFLEEGYGTNIGRPPDEEQRRQDELAFAAWMNGQYDKAIWFVRAHTLGNQSHVLQSAFATRDELIKLVAGGLSVRVTWEIIEVLGQTGWFIQTRDALPTEAEFLAAAHPNEMELKYKEMLERHLGKGELRRILEGELLATMGEKGKR